MADPFEIVAFLANSQNRVHLLAAVAETPRTRAELREGSEISRATLEHGRIIAIRSVASSAHRLIDMMPCPACEGPIELDSDHLRVVYSDTSGVTRSQRAVRLHDPDCLGAWDRSASE